MSDIESDDGAIAIVGMTGRFPGARNVPELWELLSTGREGVSRLSDASLQAAGVSPQLLANPNYVKAEAVLEDAEAFDAGFFEYSEKDAAGLDPQHRIFLECAWHALEDAGCVPEKFDGSIGVFAGVGLSRHAAGAHEPPTQASSEFADFYAHAIANSTDFLTTRLSYKLDLRGPSVAVQTACSTSLVAVHMACASLQSYECDLALAGGVGIRSTRGVGYLWQEGGIASRDGKCRAFDASATGTVPGSGAAVVALRRLSDAVRDRNNIYAVIRGTAVNNDGARKVGFTAPGIQGQMEVIAMAQGGIDPETIGMLEAHGTGTELGDAAELAALTKVFQRSGDGKPFCALGSIKTNIGHLDVASGAAGLIKAALCLKHHQLVPSLHLQTPCAGMRSDGPFYVATEMRPWPRHGAPRRAGVSSFGIGGTNAHAVLEEAPARPTPAVSEELQVFPLSARTPTALRASALALAQHLRVSPHDTPAAVARTLQHGRRAFAVRKSFLAADRESLVAELERFASSRVGADQSASPPVQRALGNGGCAAGTSALELDASTSGDKPSEAALRAAAARWEQGAQMNWEAFCRNSDCSLVSLPGYPFERKSFPVGRESHARETLNSAALPLDRWYYTAAWREMRLVHPDRRTGEAQDWLLVGWDHPIESRIAERLRRNGMRAVRWLGPHSSAAAGRDATQVDLGDDDALVRSLELLRSAGIHPTHVIYCAGSTRRAASAERAAAAQEVSAIAEQDTGMLGASALVRAFERVYPRKPYALLSVTTGAVCTPADTAVAPAQAGLQALGAVLRQEYPHVSVTTVDLPLASEEATLAECYVDWLIAEPTAYRPQTLVAYRRARRLVCKYVAEESCDVAPEREVRPEGVYVITGGLGRIGLGLAEYLARNYRARLLILSRTRLPERGKWQELLRDPGCPQWLAAKLRRLLEIERVGGAVMVASADVGDEQAVHRAVESARQALGPIRGVFHLAAELTDASAQRPIHRLSRSDVAAQFRSKVAGFHVLERVFRGVPLDFGVVFSSNSSLLGGVGLAAYAAANAYLDTAVSGSRSADDVPWIAISWDGWDENADGAADLTTLSLEEGLSALFRLLPHASARSVIVSKTDLLARLPVPSSPASGPTAESIATDASQLREKRPALATEYIAPRTELERTIVGVWEETLGIEGIGVQDDLFDLNGDSLRAMSIIARMQELFGVEVPLRQFIGKKPTVFRLSLEIAARLGSA